jgi:C-terminal processing protease CtpA/Prc
MNKMPLLFPYLRLIIVLCLLSSFTLLAFAQSSAVRSSIIQPTVVNLDFEQGSVGQVPEGWASPTSSMGYAAEVTEENPKTGKRAALLQNAPDAKSASNPFGNLMQAIDATCFRGRRVRLRAAVRMQGADQGARAQLWMRVDRERDQRGFFDNMNDRPITLGEWQYYEIVGDVEEDAAVLNIGMILLGKGKAWLDDVSLEDLGKTVILAEPARPLTRRGLENLVAFTRLLGYVRHFYPGDEAAATDWNSFAVEGVRVAEEAKGAAELAQKLETLFHPLAPSLRVFQTGQRPASSQELMPPKNEPALKIVSYRHTGFGQKKTQRYNPYVSERVSKDAPDGKAPANSPDPQKPLMAELGGGVSCRTPLALYADAKGTLPHSVSPPKNSDVPSLIKYSGNDRATRVADVALAWNIFQHFYPYFDVVQTDWPRALKDALSSAATDQDEKAFLNTLRRLVAQLHDGHGGVYHPSELMNYATPVIFGWVENRLVITQVAPQGASGLQPGDVVLKIDGKDTVETLAAMEALISGATPQWLRYVSVSDLRMGAKDSELKLEVQPREGKPRVVVLRRDAESLTLTETRPPQVSEVKSGIFYLDLDRIKDEDFLAVMPKLEQARGIIFDLRGYPKVSPAIISHLIDKPVQSARWMVPIITAPDRQGTIEYDEGGRWLLEPIAPRLTARIAFITDGRAISYAESYMGIIEAYKLASIVGEPTAGTNGDINPFTLPGGYSLSWTGLKVLKQDGSQHHGIGIRPTVPVSRTIRGVAEGKDEQLERAIIEVSK